MLTKDFVQNYPQENRLFLPEKAIARFGRGSVSATAISPDGNLIAVASRIGVWLYEAHTEDFVRLIAVNGTGLLSRVAFSPDGTQIATGDWDGIAAVWDVATGTEIVTFTKTDYVSSIAFSQDGKCLAAGIGMVMSHCGILILVKRVGLSLTTILCLQLLFLRMGCFWLPVFRRVKPMCVVLLMALRPLFKTEDGQMEKQRISLSRIHAVGTVGLSVFRLMEDT